MIKIGDQCPLEFGRRCGEECEGICEFWKGKCNYKGEKWYGG